MSVNKADIWELVIQALPGNPDDRKSYPFFMVVEDVFNLERLSGSDKVMCGRVLTGEVHKGDIILVGGSQETVVGLEMFRQILDRAEEGDNVGVLLAPSEYNHYSVIPGASVCIHSWDNFPHVDWNKLLSGIKEHYGCNIIKKELTRECNNVGRLVDKIASFIEKRGGSFSSSVTTSENQTSNNQEPKSDNKMNIDKDKVQYVVGIDLGHGETSAAYAEIGWKKKPGALEPVKDIDLPLDKTYVIPSAMAICPNGDVRIGADAFDCQDAELYVCFKKRPESLNGESEQLMIKFMKVVYGLIRERVGAILTDTNHIVYIATPSGWDKESQDLYQQMAAKAGLPIAGVTYESRAAMFNAEHSADSGLPRFVDDGAIVFDMGSSTLDFTYKRDNQKPIDFGYDCGASRVEKIMYAKLRDDNDTVVEFENKYPTATDRLLFEMRKGKEEYYRKAEHKLRKTIDFYQLVNDEDLDIIRCAYGPDQLDELLLEKGYVGEIGNAMKDFVNTHIKGLPIHAAFFTGGASRMTFLEKLVNDVWGVKYVFRDQNPSLTISQGVAEVARADVKSGGAGNIKEEIKKIMSEVDVYSTFAEKLGAKIEDEIKESIAQPIVHFRDADEDYSLADLEEDISGNINGDVENISDWAQECMTEAFEEATKDMRERMGKMMANYSKAEITMGKMSAGKIDLPDLDMDIVSTQIKDLADSFSDSASEWTGVLTGAAVGAVAAFLFTGPIGWIAGLGTLAYKFFFGDNETEEQKREKAKQKSLDKEQRARVFNDFSNKWDDICEQIHDAVQDALCDNSTKNKVNSQCKKVLQSYAEECLRKTRLMLD